MKRNFIRNIFAAALVFAVTACHDLDLNPLSSVASGNWYRDLQQIEMALNALDSAKFWRPDGDNQTD